MQQEGSQVCHCFRKRCANRSRQRSPSHRNWCWRRRGVSVFRILESASWERIQSKLHAAIVIYTGQPGPISSEGCGGDATVRAAGAKGARREARPGFKDELSIAALFASSGTLGFYPPNTPTRHQVIFTQACLHPNQAVDLGQIHCDNCKLEPSTCRLHQNYLFTCRLSRTSHSPFLNCFRCIGWGWLQEYLGISIDEMVDHTVHVGARPRRLSNNLKPSNSGSSN
jgi:hypothetical protein